MPTVTRTPARPRRPARPRSTARRPAARPAPPARVPSRVLAAVSLLTGTIAVLVGAAVVALNEPTALPEVSASLVVRSRGEVFGTEVLAVGFALLALGIGYHLGAGLGRPRGRSPRRPSRGRASRGRGRST